jgi:hypothetical protein
MGIDQQQERERAAVASFRDAGIATRYLKMEESLMHYGDGGIKIAGMHASGALRESLYNGRGLAIVGDGDRAVSVTQLACRASLLLGVPTRLYTLPWLRRVLCGQGRDGDELGELHRARVVGVLGFYDHNFKHPVPEEDLFSIGWSLKELLMDNKAFIVHTTQPLEQSAAWWHEGLVDMLQQRVVQVPVGAASRKGKH